MVTEYLKQKQDSIYTAQTAMDLKNISLTKLSNDILKTLLQSFSSSLEGERLNYLKSFPFHTYLSHSSLRLKYEDKNFQHEY